jgi:Protein of unknown function (DUF1684)
VRALAAFLALPAALAAQSPADDALRERKEYVAWLADAPNSPFGAVAQQPIGDGLELGPAAADIPLDGMQQHRVTERGGAVAIEGPDGRRVLPRGRPVPLGRYTVSVAGSPGKSVLTVFDSAGERKRAEHYAYDSASVFLGTLAPPARSGTVRVLALDGVETEASEAGTVTVPIGGTRTRLRVLRIPTGGEEESELEIFFRDETNGEGTYPAGRFVALIPEGGGRYRLDFNRARNPFCAYSTAYPCPAPWRGNTIPAPVRAGERYLGGGLSAPLLPEENS